MRWYQAPKTERKRWYFDDLALERNSLSRKPATSQAKYRMVDAGMDASEKDCLHPKHILRPEDVVGGEMS